MENKVYKCKNDMKCLISKGLRNMCRACRYSKCKRSGMNKNGIQFNREPIGQSQSDKTTCKKLSPGFHYAPTSSTRILSNPVNLPENYKPKPLETLERLKIGCEQYFYGQNGTLSSSNSDQNNRPSFTYINHDAICLLELEHVYKICKMASKYFIPFDKFDKPSKKYVLHQFFVKHQMIEMVYQTYRHASILPKNSWLLFEGSIIDENDIGAVVPHSSIRHEILQFFEQTTQILKSMKKSIEQLKIDDLERAAMSGILLWQEVASAEALWSEASDAQTVILSELHTHVLQKVGIAKAGSRIGALMSIINEVEAVSRIFLERETMEKTFDSKFLDAWESLEM
uniref:NR LBD domain-containing protein n=1 Tax=Panagrellus redivivus TaxID=6233 RepID=A0A7E4V4I5_PANRE